MNICVSFENFCYKSWIPVGFNPCSFRARYQKFMIIFHFEAGMTRIWNAKAYEQIRKGNLYAKDRERELTSSQKTKETELYFSGAATVPEPTKFLLSWAYFAAGSHGAQADVGKAALIVLVRRTCPSSLMQWFHLFQRRTLCGKLVILIFGSLRKRSSLFGIVSVTLCVWVLSAARPSNFVSRVTMRKF